MGSLHREEKCPGKTEIQPEECPVQNRLLLGHDQLLRREDDAGRAGHRGRERHISHGGHHRPRPGVEVVKNRIQGISRLRLLQILFLLPVRRAQKFLR